MAKTRKAAAAAPDMGTPSSRVEALRALAPKVRVLHRVDGEWTEDLLSDLDPERVEGLSEFGVALDTPQPSIIERALAVPGVTRITVLDTRKLGPEMLARLMAHPELRELGIVYAPLNKLPKLRWGPKLESLDVNSARPHPEFVDSLRPLKALQALDLSDFKAEVRNLGTLPALRAVTLSGWSALPINDLARCKALETLDARRVKVKGKDLKPLSKLELRDVCLPSSAVAAAVELWSLRALAFPVEGTLAPELAAAIAACDSLEHLHCFGGGVVTGDVLRKLLELPRLRSVTLCAHDRGALDALVEHPGRLESISVLQGMDEEVDEELAGALAQRPGLKSFSYPSRLPPPVVAAMLSSPTLRLVRELHDSLPADARRRLHDAGWRYYSFPSAWRLTDAR